MSDCTDLFYCRLNVYQWRYAEVVLCERPCHCECVAPDNYFHRAFSISRWTLSSPGVRVLPREGQAGGEKEAPSGLHKEGKW